MLCIIVIVVTFVCTSLFCDNHQNNNNNNDKGVEKLTKYVDLKIEVSRLWKSGKVSVIPIVVGALGSIPIDLPRYMEMVELPLYLISTFQSTFLHRTTSILRRYLSI